ncbi:MAG: hypothetical protein M9915_17535 [Rhizobacter sp.]|nr:hypothetical protein [Rhizobacter sp.]
MYDDSIRIQIEPALAKSVRAPSKARRQAPSPAERRFVNDTDVDCILERHMPDIDLPTLMTPLLARERQEAQ